jgi:hypothetical protein
LRVPVVGRGCGNARKNNQRRAACACMGGLGKEETSVWKVY